MKLSVNCPLFVVTLCWLSALPSLADDASSPANDAIKHAKSLSLAFRNAAGQSTPAVVTVVAKISSTRLRELFRDPRLRGVLPPPGVDEPDFDSLPPALGQHVGSGVIIDRDGTILTNNHVVENADEVIIRFADGTEVAAEEVRRDPLSDVAIVRIPANLVKAVARLGNSDVLDIGDWVIAIGSPFELDATVSAGIISGKGRGLDKIKRGRLLQTDAAINPGNSGGPLVNLEGEVIGINTAIATSSGGYQGVGFAIPINRAKWIAGELLTRGEVRRAYLGIRIGELTPQAARQQNLPARSGVWVLEVVADGPSAEAGVIADDVIVDFAGTPVRKPSDLQDAVEQKEIGSSQKVTVIRAGERHVMDVKMTVLPDRTPRFESREEDR